MYVNPLRDSSLTTMILFMFDVSVTFSFLQRGG